MAPGKTMVIDYCYEGIRFELTFSPHEDLYVAKFKYGDNKLMLPLNIYKYVFDEYSYIWIYPPIFSKDIGWNNNGDDCSRLFSQLVTRTTIELVALIDSLPTIPSTDDDLTEQHAQLEFLEGENLQATLKLEQTTELAEYLLEQVQTCLQSLSQALLDERKKKIQCTYDLFE